MGKSCAFFGHRNIFNQDEIRSKLKEAVVNLILYHDVDTFLLGEHGEFDALAYHTVYEIKKDYPNIILVLVAAYMYQVNRDGRYYDGVDYPHELRMHPIYAIDTRNKYVADICDHIICYVIVNRGGAYRAIARARRKKKNIINLYYSS